MRPGESVQSWLTGALGEAGPANERADARLVPAGHLALVTGLRGAAGGVASGRLRGSGRTPAGAPRPALVAPLSLSVVARRDHSRRPYPRFWHQPLRWRAATLAWTLRALPPTGSAAPPA